MSVIQVKQTMLRLARLPTLCFLTIDRSDNTLYGSGCGRGEAAA